MNRGSPRKYNFSIFDIQNDLCVVISGKKQTEVSLDNLIVIILIFRQFLSVEISRKKKNGQRFT